MHVGIAYLRWRGKRSRHSRRMRTRNFAYLARGPWGVFCATSCSMGPSYNVTWFNSLTPGRFGNNFNSVNSEYMLWIKSLGASCEIALGWITQNIFNDKSTLIRVMAWCRQATNHYLNQCWPRFTSPYDITSQSTLSWYLYHHWFRHLSFQRKQAIRSARLNRVTPIE